MIKEFKDIITRDRGSKGDAQGRLKLLATKELAYIHFMVYPNSEFITSYSEEERPEKIKKHLDLPSDWKPDVYVELAMVTYKALISTPSTDFLMEAREALFSADKIIKIIRRQLESNLQSLDCQLTGSTEEETDKEITRLLDKTVAAYDKIVKMAEKMPTTLDTVHNLEERIKKEMQQEQKGRKTSPINDFEL